LQQNAYDTPKDATMDDTLKEKTEPATNPTSTIDMQPINHPKRHTRSTLEKTALGATIIISFIGTAGFLALSLFAHTVSPDMIILLACALLSLILLISRVRWAPVVTALLALAILYILVTQPYVVESLTHPHGSNGGFGKFVGLVLSIFDSLVLFWASLGLLIQNFRTRNQLTPQWIPTGSGLMAGMLIGAIFIGAIANPPTSGTTFTNGVPTVHLSAGSFGQPVVDISKGSKLLLVDDTSSEHDLFNGSWLNGAPHAIQEPSAPTVHNLVLTGNSATIGPFVTAGTYHIFCSIHQNMNLTINVQ
jgi:hypothetical protein